MGSCRTYVRLRGDHSLYLPLFSGYHNTKMCYTPQICGCLNLWSPLCRLRRHLPIRRDYATHTVNLWLSQFVVTPLSATPTSPHKGRLCHAHRKFVVVQIGGHPSHGRFVNRPYGATSPHKGRLCCASPLQTTIYI